MFKVGDFEADGYKCMVCNVDKDDYGTWVFSVWRKPRKDGSIGKRMKIVQGYLPFLKTEFRRGK